MEEIMLPDNAPTGQQAEAQVDDLDELNLELLALAAADDDVTELEPSRGLR